MVEKILSRSVRLMFIGSVAAGMVAVAPSVMAQEASVQRIEITGSSIKRLAGETSLPVTTIRAEDFVKQGLTTAEQILNSLGSNQTSVGSSQSVGASTGGQSNADLRGLGSNKTLILLNGRRLASHPYNGDSVDLNIIPIAALERVEVLRDGASAIYGTDAIGGVINFITKRSVKGAEFTAETTAPAKKGGRDARVNMLFGMGDLDKDGFNVFGVVDAHKQTALAAVDRDFSKTGVIPNRGLNKTSGNTPSANFYDNDSGISGNMSFAKGCDPANHYVPKADGSCRYDFSSQVDDIPETQQVSFLGKAAFKLNAENTATIEYLHSDSSNINRVAAAPLYEGEGDVLAILQVPVGSKYYPGNGIVPAFPGLTGPLSINWRPLEAGKRTEKDVSKSDRFLVGAEGVLAGWDYKTGFVYAKGQASSTLTDGYTKDLGIYDGITNGKLNPFDVQDASGAAYLSSIKLLGQTVSGKTTSTSVDFKASQEFGALPGGAMGIAVGAEYRKDQANYYANAAVASQASSTGLSNSRNISGERKIGAVFAEFDAPITKQLDLTLAGRFDHYSDVGNTFNPKIGLRYQPVKEVLFRASANTGFRAPSLYELYQPPVVSNTANTYNDPKLCPGGNALPGNNPSNVCDAQQNIRSSGTPGLSPEKAKNYSFGFVLEPIPAVTLTVDYWNIHLKDSIGFIPEANFFDKPEKYASSFVRKADGNLDYVDAPNANLGDTKTDGIDVSAIWRLPQTAAGKFVMQMDGTYVTRYEYQNEKGGEYFQSVGMYGGNNPNPVFRWKHNLTMQWSQGPWSATISDKFLSGYHDQNTVAAQYKQDVSHYSIWGITGTYTGFKNLTLTAGVKNLFDTDPPFTNQGALFQQGYDARYTDPVGRAYYLRATYRF